jgi:hypothetical protein
LKTYQPYFDLNSNHWELIRDGNPLAMDIFKRHYSKYNYKDERDVKRFVGPGERIVLISKDGRALFVWRKFRSMDEQEGINCSIFRNESEILSSVLILEAEKLAIAKWGKQRFYTYINPFKIKSVNPGYCFKIAGWKFCGITKKAKLHILEKLN